MKRAAPLPSIRSRLARTLLALALGWGLIVSAAVWLALQAEVDELLDDALEAASQVVDDVLPVDAAAVAGGVVPDPQHDDTRFAWQLVDADGRVVLRSAAAPATPWVAGPATGRLDAPGWRVYGRRARGGRMLYVAQTRRERREALVEVAVSSVLSTLLVGGITAIWLRTRVRRELQPLTALSAELDRYEPLDRRRALAAPQRAELVGVHDAIGALGRRLARRVAGERAFAAHAAHALRTPLAGIDAQLAMALREAPPALQPRLQQSRTAVSRLARVVAALLALFRSGDEPVRTRVDVAELLARLPAPGLELIAEPAGAELDADPDLLAAALLNLLDNSARHGATRVTVQVDGATLRVGDDGRGIADDRRAEVLRALDADGDAAADAADAAAAGAPVVGLGLRLAQAVAQAHGGTLALPPSTRGFVVELRLQPAPAA